MGVVVVCGLSSGEALLGLPTTPKSGTEWHREHPISSFDGGSYQESQDNQESAIEREHREPLLRPLLVCLWHSPMPI